MTLMELDTASSNPQSQSVSSHHLLFNNNTVSSLISTSSSTSTSSLSSNTINKSTGAIYDTNSTHDHISSSTLQLHVEGYLNVLNPDVFNINNSSDCITSINPLDNDNRNNQQITYSKKYSRDHKSILKIKKVSPIELSTINNNIITKSSLNGNSDSIDLNLNVDLSSSTQNLNKKTSDSKNFSIISSNQRKNSIDQNNGLNSTTFKGRIIPKSLNKKNSTLQSIPSNKSRIIPSHSSQNPKDNNIINKPGSKTSLLSSRLYNTSPKNLIRNDKNLNVTKSSNDDNQNKKVRNIDPSNYDKLDVDDDNSKGLVNLSTGNQSEDAHSEIKTNNNSLDIHKSKGSLKKTYIPGDSKKPKPSLNLINKKSLESTNKPQKKDTPNDSNSADFLQGISLEKKKKIDKDNINEDIISKHTSGYNNDEEVKLQKKSEPISIAQDSDNITVFTGINNYFSKERVIEELNGEETIDNINNSPEEEKTISKINNFAEEVFDKITNDFEEGNIVSEVDDNDKKGNLDNEVDKITNDFEEGNIVSEVDDNDKKGNLDNEVDNSEEGNSVIVADDHSEEEKTVCDVNDSSEKAIVEKTDYQDEEEKVISKIDDKVEKIINNVNDNEEKIVEKIHGEVDEGKQEGEIYDCDTVEQEFSKIDDNGDQKRLVNNVHDDTVEVVRKISDETEKELVCEIDDNNTDEQELKNIENVEEKVVNDIHNHIDKVVLVETDGESDYLANIDRKSDIIESSDVENDFDEAGNNNQKYYRVGNSEKTVTSDPHHVDKISKISTILEKKEDNNIFEIEINEKPINEPLIICQNLLEVEKHNYNSSDVAVIGEFKSDNSQEGSEGINNIEKMMILDDIDLINEKIAENGAAKYPDDRSEVEVPNKNEMNDIDFDKVGIQSENELRSHHSDHDVKKSDNILSTSPSSNKESQISEISKDSNVRGNVESIEDEIEVISDGINQQNSVTVKKLEENLLHEGIESNEIYLENGVSSSADAFPCDSCEQQNFEKLLSSEDHIPSKNNIEHELLLHPISKEGKDKSEIVEVNLLQARTDEKIDLSGSFDSSEEQESSEFLGFSKEVSIPSGNTDIYNERRDHSSPHNSTNIHTERIIKKSDKLSKSVAAKKTKVNKKSDDDVGKPRHDIKETKKKKMSPTLYTTKYSKNNNNTNNIEKNQDRESDSHAKISGEETLGISVRTKNTDKLSKSVSTKYNESGILSSSLSNKLTRKESSLDRKISSGDELDNKKQSSRKKITSIISLMKNDSEISQKKLTKSKVSKKNVSIIANKNVNLSDKKLKSLGSNVAMKLKDKLKKKKLIQENTLVTSKKSDMTTVSDSKKKTLKKSKSRDILDSVVGKKEKKQNKKTIKRSFNSKMESEIFSENPKANSKDHSKKKPTKKILLDTLNKDFDTIKKSSSKLKIVEVSGSKNFSRNDNQLLKKKNKELDSMDTLQGILQIKSTKEDNLKVFDSFETLKSNVTTPKNHVVDDNQTNVEEGQAVFYMNKSDPKKITLATKMKSNDTIRSGAKFSEKTTKSFKETNTKKISVSKVSRKKKRSKKSLSNTEANGEDYNKITSESVDIPMHHHSINVNTEKFEESYYYPLHEVDIKSIANNPHKLDPESHINIEKIDIEGTSTSAADRKTTESQLGCLDCFRACKIQTIHSDDTGVVVESKRYNLVDDMTQLDFIKKIFSCSRPEAPKYQPIMPYVDTLPKSPFTIS